MSLASTDTNERSPAISEKLLRSSIICDIAVWTRSCESGPYRLAEYASQSSWTYDWKTSSAKLASEGSCSALLLDNESAGPLDDGDELILAMLSFVGTIIAEIQLVIDSMHVSSPSEALDGDALITDGVRQLMADGVSAYGI
jgi:hypothetical protein